MNRTLLLENLPDLLEDLDDRLTALEAAKPQAPQTVSQWRESLFAARLDRDAALEEVEALIAERDNLSAFVDALKTDNKRLTDGFYALEAQRSALAAQLDDLRNVNAGLRKDNKRLLYGYEHFQNCQRQAALR